MVTKDAILVPLLQVFDRLVALLVQEGLSIILRLCPEILVKLTERLALLLVVLSIEGKHVLVLPDEVIVDDELVLGLLVNVVIATRSHLLRNHHVASVAATVLS